MEGVLVGRVEAGEEFSVTLPLTSPSVPNHYIGCWQLEGTGGRGERLTLGHRVWIDISVEEKEEGWEMVKAAVREGGREGGGEEVVDDSMMATTPLPTADMPKEREEGREEGVKEVEGEKKEEEEEEEMELAKEEEEEEDDDTLLEAAATATLASIPSSLPPLSSLPSSSSSSTLTGNEWAKWSSQLQTLASMGFEARLDECVSLLERLWEQDEGGREGGEEEEARKMQSIIDALLAAEVAAAAEAEELGR